MIIIKGHYKCSFLYIVIKPFNLARAAIERASGSLRNFLRLSQTGDKKVKNSLWLKHLYIFAVLIS